jgi:hypothetical protein
MPAVKENLVRKASVLSLSREMVPDMCLQSAAGASRSERSRGRSRDGVMAASEVQGAVGGAVLEDIVRRVEGAERD